MPTEHTLLLALFGLLALTVGLLALLIYLVLSDRHRRGAEGDDLCDALLEGVAGAKREIEGTVAKTDARLSAGLSSLIPIQRPNRNGRQSPLSGLQRQRAEIWRA